MKRVIVVGLVLLLVSCNSNAAVSTDNTLNSVEVAEEKIEVKEVKTDEIEKLDVLEVGEIYLDGDFKYHIVNIREEKNDTGHYLITELEVFYSGPDTEKVAGFGQFALVDKDGEEIDCDLLAPCRPFLSGTIVSNNKLQGEVGFDLNAGSGDTFEFHIGKMFEYKPAFTISLDDIDKHFEEAFEGSNIESDYTYNVPVESECLTVVLDEAEIITDSDGNKYLACTLTVTNNSLESQSFLGGFCYDAFTSEGEALSISHHDYTMPSTIEAGTTVSGVASFKVEDQVSFYMSVTPDLSEYDKNYVISFSVNE